MFRKSLCLLLVLLLLPCAFAEEDALSCWSDGDSKTAFVDYVSAVTDETSPDFIPVVDRVAVFDLDGTLFGEQFPIYFDWMMYVSRVLDDPDYTPTEEQLAVAEDILVAARDGVIPSGLEEEHFIRNAEVFAGMTVAEYRAYVADFLNTPADRFNGLTLRDAYFRTTVQAAQYLIANDFTVYIVSGTERDADRVMLADIIGIPYRQVIGSDSYTIGSLQGDSDYLDYQYTADDVPTRTANTIIKCVKSSKPMQISQEIGQQPVIAFGNSTGDTSMFVYTTSGNPYRSLACCVIPDDDTREVAYPEKAASLTALCEENGWITISMKNDFATIYGDGVTLDLSSTPWLDRMFDLLDERLAA